MKSISPAATGIDIFSEAGVADGTANWLVTDVTAQETGLSVLSALVLNWTGATPPPNDVVTDLRNGRVAVEEGRPMPAAAWEAKKAEERAAGEDGSFFTLVYNEQHAPADQWFGEHGWRAEATPLLDYLNRLNRPIPADDPDAGPMAGSITLVSAVKG